VSVEPGALLERLGLGVILGMAGCNIGVECDVGAGDQTDENHLLDDCDA